MKKDIDKKYWKPVPFGDMCKNLNISEREPLENGIHRYVGLEHIETENLHIKSWGDVANGTTFTKRFKKGHVLFGKRRAYLHKTAMADFDGICSGDILVFEANEKTVDANLLPFIVSSERFFEYAVQTSAGSLSPRTKFQDLAKLEFLLPPKVQQAKLADLLWAADAVADKYFKILSNLQVTREVFFLSELIKYNKVSKLGDISSISYGLGVPPKANESGVPVIRATNIKRGEIVSNDLLKVIPDEVSPGKRILLDDGDIIVVRSGAYTGDIGYINSKWKGSLAGYDLVIKPYRDQINPKFLKEYLLSEACQTYFKSESTRSAQPHLNSEQLKNALIPKLSKVEQDELVFKLNIITLCFLSHNKAKNEIINCNKSLINQIFS